MSKPYCRKTNNAVCFDFTDHNEKRRVFYLGKEYSISDAESMQVFVKSLVSSRKLGKEPNLSDAERLNQLAPVIRSKLEKWDIVAPQTKRKAITLSTLTKNYLEIRKRFQVRPNTIKNDIQGVKKLLLYFDGSRLIESITECEAKNIRSLMKSDNLKTPTINRYIKRFKSIFKFAVDNQYINKNPFINVVGGASINPDTKVYIKRELIKDVLNHFPEDQKELRLIIAFARFLGLRIPSEIYYMKKADIDGKYIHINQNTKTGKRIVPITKTIQEELDHYLLNWYDEEDYLFPKLRKKTDLGNRFKKILKMLNIDPWKKIFQNLRSSCITDWNQQINNEEVLSLFCGNSRPVREQSYLQTTEQLIEQNYSYIYDDIKPIVNIKKNFDVSMNNDSQTNDNIDKMLVESYVKNIKEAYEQQQKMNKSGNKLFEEKQNAILSKMDALIVQSDSLIMYTDNKLNYLSSLETEDNDNRIKLIQQENENREGILFVKEFLQQCQEVAKFDDEEFDLLAQLVEKKCAKIPPRGIT